MITLEKSNRIKNIETKFNAPIKDLLYQMHWTEDMKHKDIGAIIDIPRVTVTKWFHRFKLPTQRCRRFTDKNLTSWLYKIGKLKKKPQYAGLDIRIQRARNRINIDFFKKWSPEMAHVLGFFAADGSMYTNPRGSKYIAFYSNDREILEKINKMLNSKYKIALKKRYNKNWKTSFLIQIGSKEMYKDLIKLGFVPNKELRLKFPNMPKDYIRHFIRGYFDGDGSVIYGYFRRKDRNNKKTPYLLTCFAYANIGFLETLSRVLMKSIGMKKGHIDKHGRHLSYSKIDSVKLFHYMYSGVSKEQCLERKYNKFLKAIKSGT